MNAKQPSLRAKGEGRRIRRARNIVRRYANATERKLMRRYERAQVVIATALLTDNLGPV